MGNVRVVVGKKRDSSATGFTEITGTPTEFSGRVSDTPPISVTGWIIEEGGSTRAWYSGAMSPSIPVPDPPDTGLIGAAIEDAVTAALSALPQPADTNAIADLIADAVETAVDTLPPVPTPADIAAAIANAVGSVHFPTLPIHATMVGDSKNPVSANLSASLGGTDKPLSLALAAQPLSLNLSAPDLKGIAAEVGGNVKGDVTARLGGTDQPIQVGPVDLSLNLNLKELPRGKVTFSLPSFWMGLTFLKWKIIGFKVELSGNLEANSTPDA